MHYENTPVRPSIKGKIFSILHVPSTVCFLGHNCSVILGKCAILLVFNWLFVASKLEIAIPKTSLSHRLE